jgi:predicted flap endonuclease-1-like 5' DNA nuclease
VGPKNEKILHSLGFFHFDQIAAWTPEQVNWVDDHLRFGGRIDREEWIAQARLLAAGNEAEFTRLYGTGGEGSKEAGLRTVRGPNEKAAEVAPSVALMSAADKAADDKAAASGKMNKPKGIGKARGGKADDLKRISGVGPKNESVLHSLGFFHFDQIAAWTATEVNWVDDHLRFGGRIKREEWIRQARLLAEGKEAEFTKLYGTGGLKNKKGETLSGSRTRKS